MGWSLVIVVALCAVRCSAQADSCSEIQDPMRCFQSELSGPRCKWCLPRDRSQEGHCMDTSEPLALCEVTDGDILEFDDNHFRSLRVETHGHFKKSSLSITPEEIEEKLFVMRLQSHPVLDNAFKLETDEFIYDFACDEYVLGTVTRTLERILNAKRFSPPNSAVHKDFPDVPTDEDSILAVIGPQTLSHLGRIAGSILPAVGIPIGGTEFNIVGTAISTFVQGARSAVGAARIAIAPVNPIAKVESLNEGSFLQGGRAFTFLNIWQAYTLIRGLVSDPQEMASILEDAEHTSEQQRRMSIIHAGNEHMLNKIAKGTAHSVAVAVSSGFSLLVSVPLDVGASTLAASEHEQNVESRAVLMVYMVCLRELLCAEHLARSRQHPSSHPTSFGRLRLPIDSSLLKLWAPALKHAKRCDIREAHPCPMGFYCHRDTLFRVNDDRNPIGYCTPATARQRELGEPCTVDSDCFSGICAPPPQPSESTRSSKPVCLSASYVDLGNCKEIRASKIVRADEGTTFEEFTTEEVEYVKERYKHALQAVASRKEAFDKVKKQLKAHRLNDPEAPYYKERERLDSWLVYFQHLSDKPPSSDSILPSCDPWLQPFLDLVKRDVEGTESRVAAQVQEHVTSSRRRRHVPFDLTRLSSNQAEAAPDQRQGSTSEHAATRRVSKVAPVIPSWMLLLQEAETANSRLDAAERELSAAEEELRQILYYQCGEERSGSTRSSALTRPKIMEWRGDIQFPVIAENDALESIFQEYDTHLKDPDVLGVHKLILINHLLGHILSAGRLEPDSPVIHWMLTICLYGDPELAMHGMYDKIQIRVAEAIAKVIPCEKIFRDWLHHAGILLLHVEDPVVNCPVIALEHLIASGCVFR